MVVTDSAKLMVDQPLPQGKGLTPLSHRANTKSTYQYLVLNKLDEEYVIHVILESLTKALSKIS